MIKLFAAIILTIAASNVNAQISPSSKYIVIDGKLKEVQKTEDQDSAEVVLTDVPVTAEAIEKEKIKAKRLKDTSTVRYSALFRDTIPISRVCAISLVAPGFAQLYNKQAWKMPILYGSVGALAYFGFSEQRKYSDLKRQYDVLVKNNAPQSEVDKVQAPMIRHNTAKTLLIAGAIAGYIYFIGDGAMNYNGPVNDVKRATTLSTICPGAGQIYNKSYWKVPIIIGGFATMGYIIDYNSRGYKRFKLAYDQITDGNDNTVDEFDGKYTAEYMRTLKNNYRRNRDLSIIITAGFYLLNIIDAHVDAHFKDYDISDDISMNIYPVLDNMYSFKSGNVNTIGLGMSFNF